MNNFQLETYEEFILFYPSGELIKVHDFIMNKIYYKYENDNIINYDYKMDVYMISDNLKKDIFNIIKQYN